MKNLISYPKHALSTFLVFFVFLMIAEAQNLTSFSQVRRVDGLMMQRFGPENVGKINYMYNSENDLGFMYLRATKDDLGNNCILTNDGLLRVNDVDICHTDDESLATVDPTVKIYVNGGGYINGDLFVDGNTNITEDLIVDGDAIKPGNGFWTVASDERLKKNINPLKNSLDVLKEVEFVEFQYNGLAKTPTEEKYYGVLAQQVGEVIPSTVKTFSEKLHPSHKNSTELLNFNPNDLIYTGLNAIKELATITEEQHEELIENLEEEKEKNRTLERRVSELENKLEQLINSIVQDNSQETSYSNEVILSGQEANRLYPNIPNPLNHSTLIKYKLSQPSDNASVLIQDMNGKNLQKIMLPNHVKNGTVEFNAKSLGLSNGTYIYALVINGELVDSKKMLFIK